MSRVPLLCWLVALGLLACDGRARLERAHADALASFQRGRLVDAAALVDGALAHAGARNDVATTRLRALRAEIVLEREVGEPVPAVGEAPANADPALRARLAKVLGQTATAARKFPEARAHFEQAARLLPADAGALDVELELRRARLLVAEGDWPHARRATDAVAALAARRGLPFWHSYALNLQAYVLLVEQRCEAALARLGEALAIARGAGADGQVVRILGMMGICAYQLGDLELARDRLQEAQRLAEQLGAVYELADLEGELGNVHFLSREPRRAITRYERAFAHAKSHAPGAAFRWLLNLTEACIAVDDWPRARQLSAESERLVRAAGELRELPYVRLHDAAIAAGEGDLATAARLYREVIATAADFNGLRWQAQVELGRVLARLGDRGESEQLFRTALANLESVRAQLSQVENRLSFLTTLIDLYDGYVEFLVQSGQSEKALRVVEGSRAGILSASLGHQSPDARISAFDPRATAARLSATLLSYWVAPERSFVWVVTPDSVERFTLPGKARLDALAERLRAFLEDSVRDVRLVPGSPAREAYDLLVAPVAHRLTRDRLVIVAPDGPLHALPFGALVGPGPRFLIEDLRVALAPSLALLPETEPAAREPTSVLAIGDPLAAGTAFPRLQHAARELALVGAAFPGARTISGAEARPEAYLRPDLDRFAILHLAAHAVANTANPLASSIVLSPGRSSRRLAVSDVLGAPVRADLVTLSACRAAGARVYSGEGLVGFSWAFLSAGARQVVAGQWDVGDGSTTELMARFYQHLARREPAVSALRLAQLELLQTEEFRSPYHWAAFGVYLGPGARSAR